MYEDKKFRQSESFLYFNRMNGANKGAFKIRSIIAASSVGTMIEWYDFYIFGMLSTTIATQFFPKEDPTAALLSTLAIFAMGFIVRPFGALVFGRLGDIIGRKYTFLLTLILMGGSTFLIGCVPNYEKIGMAAPILVLLLRCYLCSRACAGWQERILHKLDTNNSHIRFISCTRCYSFSKIQYVRCCIHG
jgi:hypothetical protein